MASTYFNVVIAVFTGILIHGADAFWRLPCYNIAGTAQIDPLVNPGELGTHVHSIKGPDTFGMSSTYDDLMAGNCTSCDVAQDKSAYWTPALYFMGSDGQTELVPEVSGFLAYYFLNKANDSDHITAFPAGFKMLAGDTDRRNMSIDTTLPQSKWPTADEAVQTDLMQRAIGFNCLDYSKAPESSLGRHFLPDKEYLDANCVDGVRFELMFPSCWNGKDLDSPNHRDHVAYPNLVMNGDCPTGFGVRLPSLFFETIISTDKFVGKDGQFVLANGDPTGFGYHGDFMSGWEPSVLQNAVDNCLDLSGEVQDCPVFDLKSETCSFPMPSELANENTTGPMSGLPGGVAVQSGPAPATKPNSGSATAIASSASSAPTSSATSATLSASYSAASSGASTDAGSLGGVYAEGKVSGGSSASVAATTPAVTSAPASAVVSSEGAASTTVYTSGQAVYHVAVVEEEVTVTASATTSVSEAGVTESAYARRHKRHWQHLRHHQVGSGR
ncbi:MAG: hypothetical protein M1819_005860 [Sarea resinae]|nr:MAG: hypothetical protein M1819_005860 [Sarea resinae]